jgi:hypothetical protein
MVKKATAEAGHPMKAVELQVKPFVLPEMLE